MSEKTTELIIYVAERQKDNPNYGATQLNKSIYYIDLMHYLISRTKLTDFEYVHQKNGPTPEPKRFMKLLQLLEENGDIETIQVPFFNYKQKKILPKRAAKIAVFEKEEIVLIDDVLKKIGELSARAASDLTHELLAWKFSANMEILPNYTFLLTSKEPDAEDYDWAWRSWNKYNQTKTQQ